MSSPKRRIELSQQAKEDFRDILSYTLTTWGESQLAKYRASINDALHVILHNPSAGRPSVKPTLKSLSENCEGCYGEGFWVWARRRGRSIPAEGYDDRANAAHSQKTRRPLGFRAKSRLASLLLGRRPMKGILPRRASPSSYLLENSAPRNFQTGSEVLAVEHHRIFYRTIDDTIYIVRILHERMDTPRHL